MICKWGETHHDYNGAWQFCEVHPWNPCEEGVRHKWARYDDERYWKTICMGFIKECVTYQIVEIGLPVPEKTGISGTVARWKVWLQSHMPR